MYTRKRNEYCIQTTVLSTPSTRVRLDVQYLNKNYISVYLNTEILSPYVLGTAEAYLNYRWVDEQTIEFSEELTGVVQFVRTTSLEDNLVKFKESPITADYVDTNNTQLLHIIQEILGGTSNARAYNFEVDGDLMYFDESVERTQMTDAVIKEVQETASTIFGTPIKVVTPDPLSWSVASRTNLAYKMVDTKATPDGVVFPKVYYIQTSEEFMAKRTILGNRYETATKSLTDDMSTQPIELKGKYSIGWAINPEGTEYWKYYLNLPAQNTHFRVHTGNVEYLDATTGEWVVLGTTKDIPVLSNVASEFIAYATDKTTYGSRSVRGNISMDSWSATDAQYVYAFDPSETDKINRALDVGAEFYLERRLESAPLYMRYHPNETECKFIVGGAGSRRFRGYKFCATRHLPLEQGKYSIDASYDANKGSDGNVLNGIAYTAARAQRTEYYDTKNPRTDVITANLRLVPMYKFNTDIRAYYKFVGDPVAAADFYAYDRPDYKYWWLQVGQYLDIMLQSVTELNTDWSDELNSAVQGIRTHLAPTKYTATDGYLDNPMEFHNSYVGRGFLASVGVLTDAGEETLHATFPNGEDYGTHSDSTHNQILNAVSDTVFPERYYVAAHKSGTVTYNGVDRDDGTIGVDIGYRIPISSIVPDSTGSAENVQKPWYVNAFVRYKLGLLEETNSDKRAFLGNPNTVSGGVSTSMPNRYVKFPEPIIEYPSITKEDSSKTILYTHWGSFERAYLPSMYPKVIQGVNTFFLSYYGGRAPDVLNIDLIKYNVYDVLPDIDTGKTELLVDATDEETYAGDTVFKQFFMDYVKKIGFYNGS